MSKDGKMQILIQPGTDGRTFPVDAHATEKMSSLIQKIADERGVEKQQLQIVYAGKTYRYGDPKTDHKTLSDLGMRDRSMLQLVTRLPGGSNLAILPYWRHKDFLCC